MSGRIWKALTIWQPWATLLAVGLKLIETRPWPTSYRGWIVIHAAAKWDATLKAICGRPLFDELLVGTPGYEAREGDLFADVEPPTPPLGAVVGVARLVAVQPTDDPRLILTARERELGDYSPGRFAWIFEEAIPFKRPIPCTGYQRLWVPPPSIIAAADKKVHFERRRD